MPYLIDGHNLIPKVPGIKLGDLDDEMALFILLNNHFKKLRKKAIVYFDCAAPGSSPVKNTAFLSAHFVNKSSSADQVIINTLKELSGDARNYTIVTSDHWIADHARAIGASVVSSEDFANILYIDDQKPTKTQKKQPDDIDYWLKIFQNKS
jgi:uncharacterized protein